jgi:hypothetical protein
LSRPYINFSIDQLEAEFQRAQAADNSKVLSQLAYELTFRKTQRARELREAISAPPHKVSPYKAHPPPKRNGPPQEVVPHNCGLETRPDNKIRPTPEQMEAVDYFLKGGSLKINAYAGTGKTSTLVMLANNTSRRGQYIAFNRDIVRDAKDKFSNTVNSSTIHGLAYRSINSKYKDNSNKLTGRLNANQLAEILNLKKWRIDKDHVLAPRSQGYLILETIRRFTQSADREAMPDHVPQHGSLLSCRLGHLDGCSSVAADNRQRRHQSDRACRKFREMEKLRFVSH